MNKIKKTICGCIYTCAFVLLFCSSQMIKLNAKESTVKTGVYADDVNLSGMTEAEALNAVESYVEKLKNTEMILIVSGGKEVKVTAGELGMVWENDDIVSDALKLGTYGNVVDRYMALKDLEYEGKVLEIELSFDVQTINDLIIQRCTLYDQSAQNAVLKRENGQFSIVSGRTGYVLDVEKSIDKIYEFMNNEWNRKEASIKLDVVIDEPKGTAEELEQVTDIIGTYSTSYRTSGSSRSANVINGCRLIDGITLYPGEEFSTYKTVSPFSEKNGYYMAGSYINGKVVDSLGGGICQVSTTLYNAVLKAELDVTERHNHSMIVTYVEPSADAAIAESAGKDFRFVNSTDYPIYIEGITTNDKNITFNIYGKETRDSGHSVKYESEVLEIINPQTDQIYADASQPIGYIVTESAHIGYKARLWKVVTENGKEVSREQINSSNYKMSPRSATVGTATDNPNALAEMNAAIASGSIDTVKATISSITNRASQVIIMDDEDD